MILTANNLSVSRGGVTLLENVSFALSEGQALIIRGPNGLGKTTLLRTVSGLQPVEEGSVEGEENIAYAGHADGLKATLTVTENLRFWAAIFGTSDIEPALEGFDLIQLRDRLAGNLSAGQKRRLGLARLMVSGRKLWVLDEPTVSLDTASVALFADAVRRHLASGGAALMATHIDLGIPEAEVLDLSQFKVTAPKLSQSDEAFL